MMIAAPENRRRLWRVAEHDIAEHHGPDDHRILIRTTTLAGASFSERLTHNSALTEMQPAAANRPRLPSSA